MSQRAKMTVTGQYCHHYRLQTRQYSHSTKTGIEKEVQRKHPMSPLTCLAVSNSPTFKNLLKTSTPGQSWTPKPCQMLLLGCLCTRAPPMLPYHACLLYALPLKVSSRRQIKWQPCLFQLCPALPYRGSITTISTDKCLSQIQDRWWLSS